MVTGRTTCKKGEKHLSERIGIVPEKGGEGKMAPGLGPKIGLTHDKKRLVTCVSVGKEGSVALLFRFDG